MEAFSPTAGTERYELASRLLTDPNAMIQRSGQNEARASSLPPTKVRWRIIAILMAIMGVTAVCRLNLSIAIKPIQDEFGFSTVTTGWLFSAFLAGYAIFQIPWGYLGDRYGPRKLLTVSILFWSVCTAAISIAPRLATGGLSVLWAFVIIRFLTGVAEAGVSPNVTRCVAFWASTGDRGLANGLPIAGLGIGGTLTPALIAWSMVHWGWRVSFYLSAILAILVVLVWRLYATDRPEQHPGVNAAELELIESGRPRRPASRGRVAWLKMLRSRSVWGLVLGYGCQGYAFYVYYNWFYLYAVKVRGLSVLTGSLWTSMPFIAMAVLSPLGGWFSDKMTGKIGLRRGRQTAVWVGMGFSAALLAVGSHTATTSVALPLIAAAAGFNMFAGAVFWAGCVDLAPNYSGSLSALMNTFGNAGGWISSLATAYVAVRHGWSRSLDVAALITACSGLLWFLVDTNKGVE